MPWTAAAPFRVAGMIDRRKLLAGSALMLAAPALVLHGEAYAGDLPDLNSPDALIRAARLLAAKAYVPRPSGLAPPFDQLTYDSYRGVRPRPGKSAALPLGTQFRADLLPPGWLFQKPVSIHLPGHDTRFSPDLFDLDPALIPLPENAQAVTGHDMPGMGFSGLRLLHPLNDPQKWDEVLVLQGASYFRALARDTVYGLSARALALGTGGPDPEEFPVTRHISVFQAGETLEFGCLIDSPRCSAALVARLTPGVVTRMTCALHLFAREMIADAGIAPLTSMFQHNGLGPARIDDFRPAVHDSDVLIIHNGADERLWRPLSNPETVQLSAFVDTGPRGFGLLQSKTAFDDFRDAEANYHRRPSLWVTPADDWGAGAVTLLEIPTANEFADNIAVFWRPAQALSAGEHRFAYDLDWTAPGHSALPESLRALPLLPVNLASGRDPGDPAQRLYVIDFKAAAAPHPDVLARLAASTTLDLADPAGVTLHGAALYPVFEGAGFLRASFLLRPDPETGLAELRLHLRAASGAPVSPVILLRWTRDRNGGV